MLKINRRFHVPHETLLPARIGVATATEIDGMVRAQRSEPRFRLFLLRARGLTALSDDLRVLKTDKGGVEGLTLRLGGGTRGRPRATRCRGEVADGLFPQVTIFANSGNIKS